jgi:hypothetical protein
VLLLHGEPPSICSGARQKLKGRFDIIIIRANNELVEAWLTIHEDELYASWNLAVRNEHFGKIAPLQ